MGSSLYSKTTGHQSIVSITIPENNQTRKPPHLYAQASASRFLCPLGVQKFLCSTFPLPGNPPPPPQSTSPSPSSFPPSPHNRQKMARPKKLPKPVYACRFCPKLYKSYSRCGQHLDGYLQEYCDVYGGIPRSTFDQLDPHPIAVIRVSRMEHVGRRPGTKHLAIRWEEQTVMMPEGEDWECVVKLVGCRNSLAANIY